MADTPLGAGLTGPPCPQRAHQDQSAPDGQPRQAMCTRCGRVTARRDPDGLAWCGGTFDWVYPFGLCHTCDRPFAPGEAFEQLGGDLFRHLTCPEAAHG